MMGRKGAVVSRSLRIVAGLVAAAFVVVAGGMLPAEATTYVPITGSGSTWSANIITQWDANVVGAFFNRRDEIVEACRLADAAINDGAIHYHDDNIARAVLSVRAK